MLWVYYQKLQEIDTEGFLRLAYEPSEGGTADQELIDGRPMSLDLLQSVEEVYRLREAWAAASRSGLPQVFVELGAGYGRLAYVCRKMIPSSHYVIVDLPEALTCSSYWLSRVLPGEVVPYAESREISGFTREVLMTRRVWTLTTQQIERISEGAADAFINIFSFAEMPKQSIDTYFSHINRITRGVFYSKQRRLEHNVVDGIDVSPETYPVRSHWRMLFQRTSSLYEDFFEVAYLVSGDGERRP